MLKLLSEYSSAEPPRGIERDDEETLTLAQLAYLEGEPRGEFGLRRAAAAMTVQEAFNAD